jgi:hypothetical protein
MSREPAVGAAAQRAIDFIQNAQDKTTGGWRYQPDKNGDNALFAWELLALKSGQRARLSIKPESLDLARNGSNRLPSERPTAPPPANSPISRTARRRRRCPPPACCAISICTRIETARSWSPVKSI